MEIIFFLVLILLIIILSGLISSSEAALLTISFAKIKEIQNSENKKIQKKAQKLLEIKNDFQKHISTIVILNNLINIMGSVYVGFLAIKIFGEIYLGLVSAVLTMCIIMFSEIIPKIYGEQFSKEISITIAGPLYFMTILFTPLLYVMNKFTNLFVKENNDNNVSEGEIMEMATIGHKEGSINSYENEVINNVFKMNDIEVYDIMVPKNKVYLVNINSSFDEIVQISEKSGHTRFPISDNGEIVGIINVKDLFKFYNNKDKFSIIKILRPVVYAPESMKIFSLEDNFKKKRNHMAIVVNEHGDFTGVVTLEDVIEELMGEIEDEYDVKEILIKKVSENVFHIDASADIDEINEKFNLKLDIDEDDDFTTLNGYIVSTMGKIPKVNDFINTENYKFRIISANRKKVLIVELILKNMYPIENPL